MLPVLNALHKKAVKAVARSVCGELLHKAQKFSNPIAWLQREWLRLLSGVTGERFTSGINTQLLGPARAELVLRQHSQHCFAHNFFRTALQHHPDRNFFQPAGKTAVVTVNLLIYLVSSQLHALGVNYHYVIAAIQMGRIVRLVLPNQEARNTRGKTPQNDAFRVHHKPILPYLEVFGLSAFWYMRPH